MWDRKCLRVWVWKCTLLRRAKKTTGREKDEVQDKMRWRGRWINESDVYVMPTKMWGEISFHSGKYWLDFISRLHFFLGLQLGNYSTTTTSRKYSTETAANRCDIWRTKWNLRRRGRTSTSKPDIVVVSIDNTTSNTTLKLEAEMETRDWETALERQRDVE